MIHEFLQRHAAWLKERIAWRLWTHDYARRRWLTMNSLRRARNAMDAGRCAHCFGTLDDPTFKTCTTCRRRRGNTQRAAQARRNAVGICARCPRNLDRDGVICTVCLAKQTTRLGKRRATQRRG